MSGAETMRILPVIFDGISGAAEVANLAKSILDGKAKKKTLIQVRVATAI